MPLCGGNGNRNDDEKSLAESIDSLNQQIKCLKWDEIKDNSLKKSLCQLAESLGFVIRKELEREKDDMAKSCRSFESLVAIDNVSWYRERNSLLTSFIHGCTGVNAKTINLSKKKFNAAIHSVEQILYTKNINMVTPFSYMRNILTYIIAKSKMGCNIAGAFEGSGSYTKVNELLNKPSDPLTIQDDSDVTITFDNEQKVGRHSGRIREASKQPISIITTVGVIVSNPASRLQFEDAQRKNFSITESLKHVNTLESLYRDVMGRYRLQFVDEMIATVLKEQFYRYKNDIADYIDVAITQDGMHVCPSCRYIDDKVFEICPRPSCNFNTGFYEHGYDKYHRTSNQHIGTPEIHYAEPTLVNPSSYNNVKLVIENIEAEILSEEKKREWAVVMCDGVPYNFGSIMQDRYRVCGICSELVELVELKSHNETHNKAADYRKPFEKIFLRPGPGHIELNMARKMLSFLWVPIMKEVANGLGFRTPNALMVFKNGIDHHRSCQVLETCLFAMGKELLLPYIRECLHSDSVPTAEGYVTWYDRSVKKQKYGFFFHVTFWYLLSFKAFKEGVRKNNSDIMMAGRSVFSPLFYCGHHPKYQRLLLRDLMERVNYPDVVSSFIKLTESHSVSGKSYGGQGGDFIHEEMNKNIKSYLQGSGIQTKKTWVNIIRKAKTIDAVKSALFENSGLQVESGRKRPKKFEHEITMIRKMFRQTNFLDAYDEEEEITSLTGDILDSSLCDFNYKAQDNYKEYKEELQNNGTYGTKKVPPIFITREERSNFEKIENKSIAEIKNELRKLSDVMSDKDASSLLMQTLDRKTNLKKHQYIKLYYQSMKAIEVEQAESVSAELSVNESGIEEDADG